MSEPLLKAILRLFAVVAREDDVTHQEREQIRVFLDEHLSQVAVESYLIVFDEYIRLLPPRTGELTPELERLNALCKEVNPDLTQKQKIVITLELTNIVQADGNISSREMEMLYAIGSNFKISTGEIEAIRTFVLGQNASQLDHNQILIRQE